MGQAQSTTTKCGIVGGGPAGMMLGLLLARSGVDVVVLEKHADFLRDFRGDTVHPSTLNLLDELGLGARFAALPHHIEPHVDIVFDQGSLTLDFTRLPTGHKHMAMVPQWDLLQLLAEAGRATGHFDLVMSAEFTDLIRRDGRVAGLRYRDRDSGTDHELAAEVVIGCDGRHSTVRDALLLPRTTVGSPFDCLYIRLPHHVGDPEHSRVRFSASGGLILIDRTDYWQAAVLIGKGQADRVLADDGALVRSVIATLAPEFEARAAEFAVADVNRLAIRLDRVRRWWAPGALCIGDAAHAMSPIAGVGINLAIQDAVATARVLVPALRAGAVDDRVLAAVPRRRMPPTVLTQSIQNAAQNHVLTAADGTDRPPVQVPQPLRTIRHLPGFAALFGRMVGWGIRPERLTGALAPLANRA